jgi:plastocyanin domain-containing protein
MLKNILLSLFVLCFMFAATSMAEEATKPYVAQIGEDGVQRVDIVGGDYFFRPNQIIVKVNVPVELRFKKESGFVPHNIMIDAPEAGIQFDLDLKSKEFRSVEFTPSKAGDYPFICSKKLLFFKSHQDKGMEGVLRVVQ